MSEIPWTGEVEQLTPILDTQQFMTVDPTAPVGEKNRRIALINSGLSKIPLREIHVTSQAELEAELGTDIEIPDSTGITIFVDESFSLSKPFKIGDNSALRIQSHVVRTSITYTGVGAMFQNTNPANLIGSLLIMDIILVGNSNSSFVDIRGILLPTPTSLFLISDLLIRDFNSLGFASMAINDIAKLLPTNITTGIFFENALAVIMSQSAITQLATHDMTFVSISTFFPATINLDIFNGFGYDATDTMFYLAPTIPLTANISITNAILTLGNLFQPGTELAAVAFVGGADPNDTQFTIPGQDLKVGQVIELADYTTFSGYNGIHRVTVINGVSSVDIDVAFLGFDATGNVNAQSLDTEDVQVSAQDNPGFQPSMSQAELIQGNPISFASIIGTFVPFQNTVPVAGDFIEDPATERFTVDTSTGIITYTGINPITNIMDFSFDIVKEGGGTDTITTTLFQNAAQISKSDRIISLSTTPTFVSFSGLLEIQPGDTFQLKMDSDAVSTINITNMKVLTR